MFSLTENNRKFSKGLRIDIGNSMKIIKTRICRIRNERRIALLFDYDEDIITLVKQIEGRKWHASNKYWHIPYQTN